MIPRKKESKKWTNLPADFSKQIKTVFEQNFKAHLGPKRLRVEGRIYLSEIVLRVGISTPGELRYQNFEVSLDHSKEKQDAIAQIHIGVDAIASLMVEYFENAENHEMPFVWQEYPFEKQKIWLQYSSENPDIEAEANRLLGLKDEAALLKETEEEMEALGLTREEITDDDLATSGEEDHDMTTPQIFGGKKKKKDDLH
ncbi:MAG: hypothetical protein H7061_03605 [Bdellovibrionaceae bacterium]|nr:hypothetical protein [Bdellovibrio sp.]